MNKQYTVPTGNTPGSGGGGGGSGTVTSVAMTGDGTVLNSVVTGSPITTAGTLAPTLKTQTANTVLAGPTSGGAVAPTFRALVSGDLPAGTGTVTSVGLTVNSTSPSGIFTVTGSPVTTSGTLNVNLAGTSGGVPYFSSGTVLSASGALTSNAVVLGGGAGSAPATQTFLTTNGSTTLTIGVIGGGNGILALAGNTSGTATFTAPSVAGTATNGVTASNVSLGPDGVIGTPTYSFSNETNSGWYRAGAGSIRLSVGGVDQLLVTAGNFQINNSSGLVDIVGASGAVIRTGSAHSGSITAGAALFQFGN
jgi:hypothetical protein